jgi:hypothetical protein
MRLDTKKSRQRKKWTPRVMWNLNENTFVRRLPGQELIFRKWKSDEKEGGKRRLVGSAARAFVVVR